MTPMEQSERKGLVGRWRKKPVVVDAWRVGSFEPRPDWTRTGNTFGGGVDYIEIHTLEGVMRAERGNWIVRGVKGELYPVRADVFAETYEPADLSSDARPAPMPEEVKATLDYLRDMWPKHAAIIVAHIDDLTRKVAEAERERDELIADLEACRADLNKSVDQPGNYIAQGALDYRAAVDGLNKATDAQVWRNPAPDASPPGAPTEGYRVVSTTDFAPPAWDRGVPDALRRFTNALIDAGWPQGATLQAANEHIEGRPLTPLSRPQETDAVLAEALASFIRAAGCYNDNTFDYRKVAGDFDGLTVGDLRRLVAFRSRPSSGPATETDTARMDWLEQQVVNVRDALPHGSRDLFWASPGSHEDSGDPSDLRAQIDRALLASVRPKQEGV